MGSWLLLIIGILIVIGTFASKISSRWGIPVLLIFLAMGMIAGADGLKWYDFNNYEAARDIANLALIFILFDSGFNTQKANLRRYFGPSILLATGGIIITAVILGFFIHLLLNMPLLESLLIGSIISSTDAAAVMTIMRERPVQSHVSTTLEIESAANDPMAILLTVFMINLVQESGSAGAHDYLMFTAKLIWQFGGGILVARLISFAAVWLFDHFKNDSQSLFYVLYVGIALSTYGIADRVGANGTIAIFFCGYWLGNSDFVFKRGVSHFIGGISSLANMCVFLMLGLLVYPSQMGNIWIQGLLLAVGLVFIARPLTILLCLLPFKYSMTDKLFIMWGGLKGAVPIVLATYPAASNLPGAETIFNIVFFVVVLSCLLQGTTLSSLANKLKLAVPKKAHSPYSLELFALDKTDFDMIDLQIHEDSPWAGKSIAELMLPGDVVISTMVRNGEIIAPRGQTVLENNDILFLMGKPKSIESLDYIAQSEE